MTHNERDFRTIIIFLLALTFAIALGLMSSNANADPLMNNLKTYENCMFMMDPEHKGPGKGWMHYCTKPGET